MTVEQAIRYITADPTSFNAVEAWKILSGTDWRHDPVLVALVAEHLPALVDGFAAVLARAVETSRAVFTLRPPTLANGDPLTWPLDVSVENAVGDVREYALVAEGDAT